MKSLALLLGVVGGLIFVYAILGRFIHGPSVFGYIFPLEAKTAVTGANTLILLAIFVAILEKK
ncbi:MAG: hypothetical protein HY761_04095 [Candidatus Omnitrophica bacterium]|nr:hypothetical protein [Candidatus Omnitrophota bacterium]